MSAFTIYQFWGSDRKMDRASAYIPETNRIFFFAIMTPFNILVKTGCNLGRKTIGRATNRGKNGIQAHDAFKNQMINTGQSLIYTLFNS